MNYPILVRLIVKKMGYLKAQSVNLNNKLELLNLLFMKMI